MALFLARFVTTAHADRLGLTFHAVLTASVFVFLAMMLIW